MPLAYLFAHCVAIYFINQNILDLSFQTLWVAMVTGVELIPKWLTESIGWCDGIFMDCVVFNLLVLFTKRNRPSFYFSSFFLLSSLSFLPFFLPPFIPSIFLIDQGASSFTPCYIILNPIKSIKQNLLNTSSVLVMVLGTRDTVDEKGV